MEMVTEKLSLKLVLRTRKIVDIANVLKNKKFEEAFFSALRNCDIDALSKIIFTIAEKEDGTKPFKNSSEVFDFLDDYKKENKKSYVDIYNEIAEVINEEGFFSQMMTSEELENKKNDIMSSIDIEDIMKKTAQTIATDIATEEFKGYKG